MAVRTCTVSLTGPSGIRHSVEVQAETVYEAAALGLHLLKQDGWTEPIAAGTQLEIQVRNPAAVHAVTVMQLRRWVDGIAVSPDEVLKKNKLKALIT